jgi:hypothetical protein
MFAVMNVLYLEIFPSQILLNQLAEFLIIVYNKNSLHTRLPGATEGFGGIGCVFRHKGSLAVHAKSLC